MAGTIVGLLSGTYFSEASEVIGLITAGGFMYVALVTVLPSLLDDSTFWQSVGDDNEVAANIFEMVHLL